MAEKARVLDLNAQRFNKTRQHELEGLYYTFAPGDYVEVPFDVAMKHLVTNDTFEVRDAEGNLIEAMRQEESSVPGSAPVAMRADETIAHFDEITFEALKDRCEKHEDFETGAHPKKDDLVAFLVSKAAKRVEPESDDDDGAEGDLEHDD